ncbi:MAG TPA: hypothetical protein VLK33_10855, partial [Terriglobales bacterium]|nr:hypothetical protein [Terriglobales bacterium]
WRWFSVLSFWWLLRLLWPRRERFAEVAALIFALYPGFSQQPIALTYSLYWMYYSFFLASLSLTIIALRSKRRGTWLTVAALALSALTMLSTEYFYGLELLRPLIIWIGLGNKTLTAQERRNKTATLWSPYFLFVIIAFAWRFVLANQPGNLYSTGLVTSFLSNPIATFANQIAIMLGDFWEAGLAAWTRVAAPLNALELSSKVTWLYAIVVLAAAGLVALALKSPKETEFKERREVFWIGTAGLLLGGLSFWIAELPLRLTFAWDRFTIPMMFGVAILFALAFDIFKVNPKAKVIFVAALLGLSTGYHFFNANTYREEWETQQNFFKQLAWRAPYIEPATALLSVEPPLEHYTDNSLTAPLNWIYSREQITDTIPYYMAYLDLRADAELLGAGDVAIDKVYRSDHYVGNNKSIIIFYYAPPACLRILDPELDTLFPKLPEILAEQAPRSNLARISAQPDIANNPQFPFWNAKPENSWCYYFEKADLARQLGNWRQVAEYGDIAFKLDDSPNHPAERTPFIEGYAHVGNWDRAIQLTEDALEINPLMQPMLCKLWERIALETTESAERTAALNQVQGNLSCPAP